MVWRDDDISFLTDIAHFKKVHNYFKEAIVLHTVALIVKDIEKAPNLIEFIKTENIDVQIHCYMHYHLVTDLEQVKKDLPICIETIERIFGYTPNVLYPCWNETSEKLIEVAKENGLVVSNKKVSLDQFIRCNGEVDEEVINFHYWAQQDIILLEPALSIYNSKR